MGSDDNENMRAATQQKAAASNGTRRPTARQRVATGMRVGIDRLLDTLGYRLISSRYFDLFDTLIPRFNRSGFTFVQVGANDGRRFDPISRYVRRFGWRGLAVEPIREYYEALRTTYSDMPQVICCHCAVYEENREVVLHRVAPGAADLPEWTKGIASILPNHHSRSGIPSIMMSTETVQGLRLSSLLERHGIERVDLLQVDAEGYDYQIVKMVDFDRYKPRMIRFEHGLSDGLMSGSDLAELVQLLLGKGYEIQVGHYDCLAYTSS